MQNRFEFLDDQFQRLADYGRKAEESFDADKNICLLNLGRIAENITQILCRRNNIPEADAEKLFTLGIIDADIHRKINTLLEIEEEAASSEYNSEIACSRLMLTAEELCRWFVYDAVESKFSFLADLFPENSPLPPLADLALYGREAEENLSLNTRYSLISLGDIGEAVVNFLFHAKSISFNPYTDDQSDKINILYREKIITSEIKDILHNIRIARNKAVHSRYNSFEEGRDLIAQALPLCEWLFKLVMSPGDFLRGKITSINENKINVSIGRFEGIAEDEELADEETGRRKIFKIISIQDEQINLSLKEVYTNPWINAARRYEKYKIGQDLNVKVTHVEKDIGATVEVLGTYETTEARIPESEYGSRKPSENEKVKARVKWFNPSCYPYMILSVKDAPQEINFARFCAKSPIEEIREKISAVDDINKKNLSGMTALMMAALHNSNPEVINLLVEAGAKINAVNYAGNTALILAARYNTPEVVRALLENGADITIMNGKNKAAYDYAVNNRKLEDSDVIDMLKLKKILTDDEFLELCKFGSCEEIIEAINDGANIDAEDEKNNTALMLAVRYNTVEAVRELLPRVSDINAKNINGDNALIIAAMFNTAEAVDAILEAKPEINLHDGNSRELAKKLSKKFMSLCKSGSPEEISEYIKIGINVNIRLAKTLATPLMLAVQNNSLEVIKILLEANADINAQDARGYTALILASGKRDEEILSLLLDHEPDVNIIDERGYKAVNYAAGNPNLKGTEGFKRLKALTHN